MHARRAWFYHHILRRERSFQIGESNVGTLEIAFGLLHSKWSHSPQVLMNQCLTNEGDSQRRTGR